MLRTRWLLVAALGVALGCGEATPIDDGSDVAAQLARRDDGWLRGDLHMHTQHSDGFETTAEVIALAEYLEDPAFLAFNPAFEDCGLDYIAITDHGTFAASQEAEFVSDRLVLIPGEEKGVGGHANLWGLSAEVDFDPDGDGISDEDVEAAIEALHAQGALFSANHPLNADIAFGRDVRNLDAVEVWNSSWSMTSRETSVDDLAEWEATHGPASPFYRRAVEVTGRGASWQALVYYEALLARGVHVAVVGGSDRHALVLPGFPTTWVQAPSTDVAGVLEGLRQRHTFVARTPASAQILGSLSFGGETYGFGDQVPVPAAGAEVTLEVQVARGRGGRLQVLAGERARCDRALACSEPMSAPLLWGEIVSNEEESFAVTWHASPGDWVFPVVFEPLIAEGTAPDLHAWVRAKAADMVASGGDVEDLIPVLIDLLPDAVGDPDRFCKPDEWDPTLPQCVPVDHSVPGTIYIPDVWDRAMNVLAEDNQATEWSMGAIASAILFVGE